VEEVCPAPEIAAIFQPDVVEAEMLVGRYKRFKALYRAVEGLFPAA
jgi:xylulokinase